MLSYLRKAEEDAVAAIVPDTDEDVIWMTPDETRAWFDAECVRFVGMSSDEFVRRLDAGEFDAIMDTAEHPDLMWLVSMASVAR